MDCAGSVVLRLDGITKRFGKLVANDAISLDLHAGEVVALLGENGAGKTTLMNILFGQYAADAGTVEVFGKALPPGVPRAALAAGVGMVHQHFTLADNLTVEDNITLGTEPLGRMWRRKRTARRRIADLSARFHLAVDPRARVADLTVGERQRVEILKALYRDVRILILDEPTAVLTPQEARDLFSTLREAVAEGMAVIFISHKLDEVMAISDRVAVLRHGRLVGDIPTAETDAHQLAERMMGQAAQQPPRIAPAHPGPALLTLEHVSTRGTGAGPGLWDVTLRLRAGQITGLAGVSGNGQAALSGVIAGTVRPTSGRMSVLGAVPDAWDPRAALAAGVGRIPEDRHRTGTVADFTLTENAVLERYNAPPFARRGWRDRACERAFAERIIADFDVRCPGPDTRIRLLSGGNMQKLILGRALTSEPKIILADQPVRGLDVGAVSYVHGQLLAARERGAAVLLISEDLDEILALSDVIQVIYEGRLTRAVTRGEVAPAELGLWMAGRGSLETAHAS